MTPCSRRGCDRPADHGCRGYCDSDYRRALRMGIYGYRDPAPARAHVLQLRALGWTWEQIAEEARLSVWVPHQLGMGRTRRLWPHSERALLAIPLVPRASRRGVDSTGTRRRVQALAWMGWPCAEVARKAGTTAGSLSTLIQPRRRISQALALRVAEVYEELCMTRGPSPHAAALARARGWVTPLAWDDIDDPAATPSGAIGDGRAE